jgi:hypothetical protein
MGKSEDASIGISERKRGIMTRLLRMAPEQQKAAPKPKSAKGAAQRRRREAGRNAVRIAEVKFGKVAVQVAFAAMLVDAFHTTLED